MIYMKLYFQWNWRQYRNTKQIQWLSRINSILYSYHQTSEVPPAIFNSRTMSAKEFHQRCQQPDESFEQFYNDIFRLAQSCDFGHLQNEMLRNRIVDGIREPNTKMQLQKMTNLTLANALGLCRMADILRSRSTDTINGAVVPTGRDDAALQSGASTECVLQNCADAGGKTNKVKVEVKY